MCLSRLGQIIYGILAFITLGLIAASMFTPGWRSFYMKITNATDAIQKGEFPTGVADINMGIFFCQMPTNMTTSDNSSGITTATTSYITSTSPTEANKTLLNIALDKAVDYCKDWWAILAGWEKVVIVVMVLALGTALLAFLWNLFTFCACFCKGSITKPLPGLAGLTTILLGIALGVFYYYNQGYISNLEKELKTENITDIGAAIKNNVEIAFNFVKGLDGKNDQQGRVSYSFYLGCGAAITAFINMIVGSLIVCLADKCL